MRAGRAQLGRHPGPVAGLPPADLAAGLVLVDPGHEEMESGLPLVLQWGWRVTRAIRPDELHGEVTESDAALRELRAAARPFPDVPVVVLSASRSFPLPRRFRAHWTRLQAGLAAAARRDVMSLSTARPQHPQRPARRRGRRDPRGSGPGADQRRLPVIPDVACRAALSYVIFLTRPEPASGLRATGAAGPRSAAPRSSSPISSNSPSSGSSGLTPPSPAGWPSGRRGRTPGSRSGCRACG